MFALVLVLVCFYVTHLVIDALAGANPLLYFLLWLAYYVGGEVAHRREWLYCPSVRRSRFARWVGRRLVGVRVTRDATRRMKRLARLRGEGTPIIFACMPHNPYCLHATFCFAAHGDFTGLPPAITDRTFVVGHWSQRYIPLVRDVLSLFGVVASLAGAVRPILERGDHLCLMPDGVFGKFVALNTGERTDKQLVLPINTHSLGWAVYAVRHAALVIPVVSPDEPSAYEYYRPLPSRGALYQWAAPLIVPWGRWGVLPRHKIKVFVGNAVDASELNGETDDSDLLAQLVIQVYNSAQRSICKQYKIRKVWSTDVRATQ